MLRELAQEGGSSVGLLLVGAPGDVWEGRSPIPILHKIKTSIINFKDGENKMTVLHRYLGSSFIRQAAWSNVIKETLTFN